MNGRNLVIRIFLVCDDLLFCKKLQDFFNLQDDFQVCGVSTTSASAIQDAGELLPDVAVLVMNDVHDLNVTDTFEGVMPDLPLFLMTQTLDIETERKVLSRGVDAVFSADDDLAALVLNARGICNKSISCLLD
jgi:DNA-binding NarL/FixJ family response regulator